jgi:hypothetical protein
MRRQLGILTATVGLLAGAVLGASQAAATDSLGWDAGTQCLYGTTGHFSVVKVQWAYHASGNYWLYKPYAVRVLEADGAHHQTVNWGKFEHIINGETFQSQVWSGATTYTFGPTRLSNMTYYGVKTPTTGLQTTLKSPDGQTCSTWNQPG